MVVIFYTHLKLKLGIQYDKEGNQLGDSFSYVAADNTYNNCLNYNGYWDTSHVVNNFHSALIDRDLKEAGVEGFESWGSATAYFCNNNSSTLATIVFSNGNYIDYQTFKYTVYDRNR
ncbi:MAG: hypothetical protein IKP28_04640 [Clostridia bacterium]|nr:hypothetical protein [Clostridia bacterium]